MHLLRLRRTLQTLLQLAGITGLATGTLFASNDPVAVISHVYNGYTRGRLPDQSFKPEYYTFAEGSCWSEGLKTPSMEKLTFRDVARAAVGPLARMKYLPAAKAADAQLLILVFWGATEGRGENDPSGALNQFSTAYNDAMSQGRRNYESQLVEQGRGGEKMKIPNTPELDVALAMMNFETRRRERIDAANAPILGYSAALQHAWDTPYLSSSGEVLEEIAQNRYFIVLQAYDFQAAWKEKKLNSLWTVRISIAEKGNEFGDALATMLTKGAHLFGQKSRGLNRWVVPEGRVDLGPTKAMETVEAK